MIDTTPVRGFSLGDRVRFTATFERIAVGNRRGWAVVPELGEGLVVGHRVVQEGSIEHEYPDSMFSQPYTVWEPSGFVPCLLVAVSMRGAHLKVPLYAVTILGDEV